MVLSGFAGAALAYRDIELTAPFTVELSIYNGDEPLSGCHPFRAGVGLRLGNTWTNPSRNFISFKGDSIYAGDAKTFLGNYSTLKWYKIKISYERPTSNSVKLSYWIDGNFKGSIEESTIAKEDSLLNFELNVQEGSAWFDNIIVTPISESNLISGLVNDYKIDLENGNIEKKPLECYVSLINNNSIISTITTTKGRFSFDDLTTGNYSIKINKTGKVPNTENEYTLYSTYPAFVGQNFSIEFPFSLIGQNRMLLDSLQNLTVNQELLFGFLKTELPIKGYDINSANLLLNNWSTINSNFDNINNSLSRLLLTEKATKDYYYDASIMSVETMKSFYEVAKSIVSVLKIGNTLENLTNIELLKNLVSSLVKLTVEAFKTIITHAISKIPPPQGPELMRITNAGISALEVIDFNKLDANLIKETVKELLVVSISGLMLEDLYIPQWTQSILNESVNKSHNFSYEDNFSDSYFQYRTNTIVHYQNTLQARNQCNDLRNISGLATAASEYLDIASAIAAATVIGTTITAILKSLSTISKIVSVGTSVGAFSISGFNFANTPYALNTTTNKIYIPSFQQN